MQGSSQPSRATCAERELQCVRRVSRRGMGVRMRRSLCALAVSAAGFAATAAPAQGDQPAPHVGFYAIHPRVGLSTYFALSDSWPNTTKPLQIVAKIHSPGQPCAATPTTDTGRIFATARLRKSPSDTVWQDWTPTTSGSY